MDYRKAWDEVKAKLEESVEEGLDNGYDKGSGTSFENGAYHAYKRVLDHMKELESEVVSKEIRVGDTVRVVNGDLCYNVYQDWIKINVSNPFLAVRWAACRAIRNGAVGLVRYIAPHGQFDNVLAYIEVDNACYIMDLEGLEKI